MAAAHQQRDQSYTPMNEASTTRIILPDGYELAHYTLRRVHDGHLQTYSAVNGSATPVQATPIDAQTSETQLQRFRQAKNSYADSDSLLPNASTSQSSYLTQTPDQHLHSTLSYGGHGNLAYASHGAQGLSAKTQKRHAHSRDDDYTDVCGVFSPAKATPVKKYNPGKGIFRCPRCGSNYTRPKSVKDHFPDCVSKCGNPQALRYTDHPSMAKKEAAIQSSSRASREVSSMDTEDDDTETEEDVQGIKFEEMNDALARTSIQAIRSSTPAYDGTRIKTEFVFGADIPLESIETPSPENQSRLVLLDDQHTSLRPTSFRNQMQIAQTPDWLASYATSPRPGSSTPTCHTNPWNTGVPGSAAEHVIADMRATVPFEGHLHESPTPERTNGDGLQGDSLDGFMDRRSYFSPTPAVYASPKHAECIYEDSEMEE